MKLMKTINLEMELYSTVITNQKHLIDLLIALE